AGHAIGRDCGSPGGTSNPLPGRLFGRADGYTGGMTVHDALAEGRLAQAIALQEAAAATNPHGPAARRLLVDLLAFAGRLDDALEHLTAIRSDEPEWPEVE